MSSQSQAALLAAGTQVTYRPLEVLLRQGDHGEQAGHAVLLLAGCTKVVAHTENGGKALLAVRVGGDLVGEMAAFDGGPRSASVVAATSVTARRIGTTQLAQLIHRYPDLGMSITIIANERLRWANRRRVEFVSLGARERIARVLVEIAETYGEPDPRGVRLDVFLTQDDIATLAGQRLPTAERWLRDLEERCHLLQRGRRQILITDLEGLRAVAQVTTGKPSKKGDGTSPGWQRGGGLPHPRPPEE